MIRAFLSFLSVILCTICFSDDSLTSKIPLNLWQTYKTKTLPLQAIDTQQSWIQLNPEFSCYLYDDADIELYIRQKWGPEFLDFFHALPIGAMKADLWRYLILASEGGVYTDIDSVCIQPIRDWPLNGRASNHVLLLDLDSNQSQFCQWTIACTPGHPAMLYICNYVLKKWKKGGLPRNDDGKIDVLAATGPGIFTSAIRSYLEESHKTGASKIVKQYFNDKKYRKHLNQSGIFFTRKGFFSGGGAKNLFWGSSQCLGDAYNSWSKEAEQLAEEREGEE